KPKLQVEKKVDLVNGGGNIGLMGLVSQTVYDGGCHVLGIIPGALILVEIKEETEKHTAGELLIVSDMHERMAEMARRADAFIALPGGYGTMEELLEVITWSQSQLGIHHKPVRYKLLISLSLSLTLLFFDNKKNMYDSLLSLFDKGVQEGFIKPSSRNILISANNSQDSRPFTENGVDSYSTLANCQEERLSLQLRVATTNDFRE
ncbi:hypothetical protein Dsin_018933, partial [Dipteronia sinensis]